jgi:signal-transduction protein with cAMP-binding, CBS, and nucleotidyltransferase domain
MFSIVFSTRLFDHLRDDQLHQLADLVDSEHFSYQECIARQGSFGSTLFIISQGQVYTHIV